MVNGVPQVRAMLKHKGAAVVDAARAAARKGAEEMTDAMRFLVPRDQSELYRSIRVEDAATINTGQGEREFVGVVVKAGDETTIVTNERGQRFQNARIQEFGTKERAANPYFYPAYRANRSRVRAAMTRAIRKAWTSG